MDRSIYSLTLMDDVVEALDRLAAERRTSRSNLANQILAEYLQCETPEMRIQAVLSEMLEQSKRIPQFLSMEQTSARMLTVQSRVPYSYNPTAQYVVEIYRVPKGKEDGRLRAQVRTQNSGLLHELDAFFRMWAGWEQLYIPAMKNRTYQFGEGRMERSLHHPVPCHKEPFGELVAEYIRCLDHYMRAFLQGEPVRVMEERFRKEMTNQNDYV